MLNVYNQRLLTFFIHCEKTRFLTFFILFATFSTSMAHPKAIEVVAILGMEFRRNLMNTMDQ